MPIYSFKCKKCQKTYDDLLDFDPTGRYKDAKCEHCGSKKKEKLSHNCAIAFANPQDSSKWESFSYRAGKTMEDAKDLRRRAEAQSHMGDQPYYKIDDSKNDNAFDVSKV